MGDQGNGNRVWRSRWAAIGAAVAVSLGAGGVFFADAASPPSSVVMMVAPARILDTRDPVNVGLNGPFVSPIGQDRQVTGLIATTTGPATIVPVGATGVILNVTVVAPSASGFLSVRPANAPGAPTTSNLNFLAGQLVPNALSVELSTAGPDAGRIEIAYDAYGIAAIEAGSGESRAAHSAGSQNLSLTTTDVVVRSVTLTPTADGKVIATAAATVVRGTLSAFNVRCSITTGSAVDGATAHSAYFGASTTISDFQSLVGTRGFDVVKSVPVTVHLVCDTTALTGGINFSSLTAVFAPN